MTEQQPPMIVIAIVGNSTHGGGAENSMMQLHVEFQSIGYRSTYIAVNNMDNERELNTNNIIRIGRRWSDGLSQTFKYQKIFRRELKALDPEVILVNCELPELFTAAVRLPKAKLIVIEHTTRPWNGRRPLGVFIRFLLKLRGASWVTVNVVNEKIWPFGQSAVHIPNPVRIVEKSKLITDEKSVVFVGRLRKEKCPEMVVQACLESAVSISLIGEGNLRAELQSRYGQSEFIEFLGYLESPWSGISPRSLVVVSSEYEGDGIVVLEALQNENPILLRDIPDLRRFNLKNENYFKDKEDLVNKLREFRAKPSLFTVSGSERDRILSTRDIRVVAKQWATLIEDLVEGER